MTILQRFWDFLFLFLSSLLHTALKISPALSQRFDILLRGCMLTTSTWVKYTGTRISESPVIHHQTITTTDSHLQAPGQPASTHSYPKQSRTDPEEKRVPPDSHSGSDYVMGEYWKRDSFRLEELEGPGGL